MSSIVLASASKIRSDILRCAGVPHTCEASTVDEDIIKNKSRTQGGDVETAAATLADAKAADVGARYPDALVIGADQILECDGRWFDKPPDLDAAAETLRALRGRRHRLICAVSVYRGGANVWRHLETPALTMRDFSDGFLERYLDGSGAGILESVGAYRLEAAGAQLFSRIDGDYFAILGLPLLALLEFLRKVGAVEE
ncbi:MAG: Maf family protein [Proteobacteria bacterium]|nr:Maf family protein [Pseudomonadota bacterium]